MIKTKIPSVKRCPLAPGKINKKLFGIFVLSLALFLPLPAKAHKISLFAWPEGNKICAQSYFAKNRPAMNVNITASSGNGQLLASGKTDKDGLWCFAQPEADFMLLSVNSGDGHKADFELRLSEAEKNNAQLPEQKTTAAKESSGPKNNFQQLIPRASPSPAGADQAITSTAPAAASPDSQKALQELLSEVRALQHSVAELQQDLRQQGETSLKDIFAGLGWIAGLMALLWFMKSRQPKS